MSSPVQMPKAPPLGWFTGLARGARNPLISRLPLAAGVVFFALATAIAVSSGPASWSIGAAAIGATYLAFRCCAASRAPGAGEDGGSDALAAPSKSRSAVQGVRQHDDDQGKLDLLLESEDRLRSEIREHQQSREALAKRIDEIQEKAELLDLAHDAIIIRSMSGEIQDWNRGAEAMYGWRKMEVVGKIAHSVLKTQFSRPLLQIENHLLRQGRWEGSFVQFQRGGQRRVIASRWALKRNKQGEPIRVLEINSDVTERRQAEESLQFLSDASENLASLVDYEEVLNRAAMLVTPAAADWCVIFHEDKSGAMRPIASSQSEAHRQAREDSGAIESECDVSPLLVRVFRDSQSELIANLTGEAWRAIHPEHAAWCQSLCHSLIGIPLVVRGQLVGAIALMNDGSGRQFDTSDLVVAEEYVHRVAVALENAQLYAEARETARRKDEFIATLAHELRNPLAPIRNAVEIMGLCEVADPDLSWARDAIGRQVQLLTRLVDDLLDVSRISRGKVELRLADVELRPIINRAVETSKPWIEQGGHQIEVQMPSVPVPLHADAARLEQVLANLLNNAAKYTEPGGKIAVLVEAEPRLARIRVRDTGIGMSPEFLPRAFDIFVQAEHHHGRAQGGLGIGLSLVRRLIELHGGKVSVHSGGPGLGSEFIIELPRIETKEETASVAPPVAARSSQGLHVLVVDDNVDAGTSLAMLLSALGHHPQIAYEAATALRMIDNEEFVLAFLDIGLPGMSGHELARRIRAGKGCSGLTLVALTGWGQEEDRRRTDASGFDHHLTKPADFDALQRILAEVAAAQSNTVSLR